MIIKYPDSILLQKSEEVPVEEFERIKNLLDLESKNITWGTVVGLAAPQIGVSKRAFMALGKHYFNPIIIFQSPVKKKCLEGCYSLEENKFDYEVMRSLFVRLKWQNIKGSWQEKKFEGFEAQIIQHEMDHLNGKLCC